MIQFGDLYVMVKIRTSTILHLPSHLLLQLLRLLPRPSKLGLVLHTLLHSLVCIALS